LAIDASKTARPQAGEVLISRMVADLVAGSGLEFEDSATDGQNEELAPDVHYRWTNP
jgi:hypothetical protein